MNLQFGFVIYIAYPVGNSKMICCLQSQLKYFVFFKRICRAKSLSFDFGIDFALLNLFYKFHDNTLINNQVLQEANCLHDIK